MGHGDNWFVTEVRVSTDTLLSVEETRSHLSRITLDPFPLEITLMHSSIHLGQLFLHSGEGEFRNLSLSGLLTNFTWGDHQANHHQTV